MQTIDIALIDDHPVVLNGLQMMLAGAEGVRLLFATSSHTELLEWMQTNQPHILLTDIQMPGMAGTDLCRLVRRQYPDVRLIALSTFDDSTYVKNMLRQGAQGYLLKNTSLENLLKALHTVQAGERYIDESLQKLMLEESISGSRRSLYEMPLTRREKEILRMIAEEKTNAEIAAELFISSRTVDTHRQNLLQKLAVKNTAGLVKEALKRGLIQE